MREVYLITIIGILRQFARLGVIDVNTLSVVADNQLTVVAAIEREDGLGPTDVDVLEVTSLCRMDVDTVLVSANIDIALTVFADAADGVAHGLIGKILLNVFPVVFDEAVLLSDQPQVSVVIFLNVLHGVNILQRPAYLLGMLMVAESQQTMSGGTCQEMTVLTLKETGDITGYDVSVKILHLYIAETYTVVGLQGTVHTDVEETVIVLQDTVHVIAGHASILPLLLLQDMELVAIVFIESIAGGNPNEAVTIKIYLIGETAGQLCVGIKQFARLCLSAQREYE